MSPRPPVGISPQWSLPPWPEAIRRWHANSILFVQDLTIRYDTAIAVDALCLEVHSGEVFRPARAWAMAPGKSSTLAAVSGDLKPAAGVVRVGGLRIDAEPLAYRRQLDGLVPQELALYDDLTGAENLLLLRATLRARRPGRMRQRVAEVLAMVRLTDVATRLVRTWSGGMQRRLNLAYALLHQPDLLLLDEPTVGLDLQSHGRRRRGPPRRPRAAAVPWS